MRLAPVVKEKIDIFHACLNVLQANADGRLAYLEFLDSCLDVGSYEEEITETILYREELADLERKLWEGDCPDLRQAKSQNTNSSQQKILNYLEEVMHGTRERAYITEQLLLFGDLTKKRETLCLLTGLFVFQVELRRSYVEGLLRLSRYSHFPDAELWWEEQLTAAQVTAKRAEEYTIPLIESQILDENFSYSLREASILLPAIFRCQLQDIHQIYQMLLRPSPCSDFAVSEEDVKKWEECGLEGDSAGYWRAYGMELEEAQEWRSRGFPEPGLAGPWKYRDFDAEEAQEWAEAGFHPKQAAFFRSAGCEYPEDAERAQSMVN